MIWPTSAEVRRAIDKLKPGKAAGASRILPELVKYGGFPLRDRMLDLFGAVWNSGQVPQEWVDATLVPIPKKGDLQLCDNWRGIALLDVVGKVLAAIIQTRLQRLAETLLPDSQCGFRRGRSCSDMIFSVRQLVEKSLEHDTKGYMVFIDLRKAYDSVPRECMWRVLACAGVPDTLLAVIKSFHTIRTSQGHTQPININNGLRQGCSMAPVLFNLFMWAVFTVWSRRVSAVPGVGMEVRYCIDGNLFGKPRTRKISTKFGECQFADNLALLATTRDGAQLALSVFQATAADFGLTVSTTKTQFMVCGSNIQDADCVPLTLADVEIKNVAEFRYLGSIIASNSRSAVDVNARIASASKACGALQRPVFANGQLPVFLKRCVFNACVMSLLLYGSECWVPLQGDLQRLSTFHMRCVRSILGVSRQQMWDAHISNAELLRMWGDPETITCKLRHRRLEWLGHLARMDDTRMPKCLLFGQLPPVRPAHGPRKRWKDCVSVDLRQNQIVNWYQTANTSRVEWRCRYQDQDKELAAAAPVECPTCGKVCSRPSDLKRHKCTAERRKPVHQQRGACQCADCGRWYRSRGGLAVHRCQPASIASQPASAPCRPRQNRPTTDERAKFPLMCQHCSRRFRQSRDLTRHRRVCSSPSSRNGTT